MFQPFNLFNNFNPKGSCEDRRPQDRSPAPPPLVKGTPILTICSPVLHLLVKYPAENKIEFAHAMACQNPRHKTIHFLYECHVFVACRGGLPPSTHLDYGVLLWTMSNPLLMAHDETSLGFTFSLRANLEWARA